MGLVNYIINVTALFRAIIKNNLEIVSLLLNRKEIDMTLKAVLFELIQ